MSQNNCEKRDGNLPSEPYFDRFAPEYETLNLKDKAFFDSSGRYFAEYKVDLAKSLDLPSPGRILDFGCGVGRSLPFLRDRWPLAQIWGLDPSQESLRIARERNPDCSFSQSLASLLQQQTRFDLIFVATVLHHIPLKEHRSLFRMFLQILSPGGHLVIFDHNPYNPVTQFIVGRCPFDEDAELISCPCMRKNLMQAGFDVLGSGYTLFFPQAFHRIRWLERYLKKFPLGGQYYVHAKRAFEGRAG